VTAGQGPAIERIVVLAADRSWFASARLGDGGAFALTGVAPGTYDLRLGAGSAEFDAVPARVDIGPDGRVGVVLGVGRPCEDR
jgi:hypothetical protein